MVLSCAEDVDSRGERDGAEHLPDTTGISWKVAVRYLEDIKLRCRLMLEINGGQFIGFVVDDSATAADAPQVLCHGDEPRAAAPYISVSTGVTLTIITSTKEGG